MPEVRKPLLDRLIQNSGQQLGAESIRGKYSASSQRKYPFGLVLGLIVSLFVFATGVFYSFRNWQFSQGAEHVMGSVDTLSISHSGGGPHGVGGSGCVLRYHYLAGKVVHSDDAQITSTTWNQLHEGGVVPVKYLQSNPSLSRIDLPREDHFHLILARILSAIGFLLFVYLSYFLRRKQRFGDA